VKVNKDQWELAKARRLAGESWAEIANDLQVNKATLEQRAFKTGFSKIVSMVKEVSLEKRNPVIEQSIESLSKLMRSKLASDAVSTLERVDKYDISDIREENTREQVLSSLAKRSALVFGWNDQSENATVSINLLNALPDKVITVTDDKQIQ
jgi:hypothetical protein